MVAKLDKIAAVHSDPATLSVVLSPSSSVGNSSLQTIFSYVKSRETPVVWWMYTLMRVGSMGVNQVTLASDLYGILQSQEAVVVKAIGGIGSYGSLLAYLQGEYTQLELYNSFVSLWVNTSSANL